MLMQELQEGWLKCEEISSGMFSNECAVQCTSADNGPFSFFINSDLVKENEKLVRVNILDRKGDYCLIYLPATPIEGLSKTIRVFGQYVIENYKGK